MIKPKPGSKEAIDAGCICPTSDNANGKGIEIDGETYSWIEAECEIHGTKPPPVDSDCNSHTT